MHKIYELARSVGNRMGLNAMPRALAGDDIFDADAQLPNASPYVGIGWGHSQGSAAGLRLYANLGVIVGRPVINLSPPSGLATRFNPSTVAGEQPSS